MHCKFLVFVLAVFFCFSFFSSACEFRFVERIGAHGKQTPDFIIINTSTMGRFSPILRVSRVLIAAVGKKKKKK